MSSRLFHRGLSLTIAKVKTDDYWQTSNELIITGLRVSFQIERNLHSEPNPSMVKVWNLSEQSRSEVQGKNVQIKLDAGYDGELSRLLTGDVLWQESSWQRVDWITSLQVSDGHRAYKYARVNRSFRGGGNFRDLLAENAKAMGLKVPKSVDDAKELAETFLSGTSVHGPASREMDKVLRPRGYTWSIQDGELQILKRDQVRADEAILITPDTGMLGSPEYGTPPKKGEPPLLKVKKLLDGRLIPGRKVKVESRKVNAFFRIERVVHVGDTHGGSGAWVSDLEVKQL